MTLKYPSMKISLFNVNITPVSSFCGPFDRPFVGPGTHFKNMFSENTDKWVRGGLEQVNEMCYAFIYYYPRLEDISFCTSMTTFEVSISH